MAFEIFGYEIFKKVDKSQLKTFQVEKDHEVDQIVDEDSPQTTAAGITAYGIESTNAFQEEQGIIRQCRQLAMNSEIDEALQEIRNETFIFDVPGQKAFEPDFLEDDPDCQISADIQKKIRNEFDTLYQIIDFDDKGLEFFDDWYIDGKLYLHKIVDEKRPKDGIKKIIAIDPLKLRKLKIMPKPDLNGVYDLNKVEEFYVYSDTFDDSLKYGETNSINWNATVKGLRIEPDSICFVDSGLIDRTTGKYTSYLRKAILPWNNLRMMEDAMLIFRVVRAPQRRVIYIDVQGMQKNKADAYMKDMMARFKNKMIYDSKTGSLASKRNILSMIEDYWLPRRDGGKGTEVQNLEGGDNNGVMEEVSYYRDKLWRSLNVPRSRFGGDGNEPAPFMFGKGVEIQRDEFRFKKFIDRIRLHFVKFMEDLLHTQLILKKIIVEEDWADIQRALTWTFAEDNAFVEFKESEIINNRVAILNEVDPLVGKYFSRDWVQKKILRMSDDEQQNEKEQMEKEAQEDLQKTMNQAFVQGQVTAATTPNPESGKMPGAPNTLQSLPPIPINQYPGSPAGPQQ